MRVRACLRLGQVDACHVATIHSRVAWAVVVDGYVKAVEPNIAGSPGLFPHARSMRLPCCDCSEGPPAAKWKGGCSWGRCAASVAPAQVSQRSNPCDSVLGRPWGTAWQHQLPHVALRGYMGAADSVLHCLCPRDWPLPPTRVMRDIGYRGSRFGLAHCCDPAASVLPGAAAVLATSPTRSGGIIYSRRHMSP